jgi:glutamine transport system ATP-binding protein
MGREEASDHMSFIEISNVTKHYGSVAVLKGISLSVDEGEVVLLIGPSGSGKSTLLRCINALETITGGDLVVDGLSVRGNNRQVRRIRLEAGMVFQQFNLFPHMTALQNVMFGPLRIRGLGRLESKRIAESLLADVGLTDRMHHYPNEMSGGQQQRTAIARALAVQPRLMLFDEPTSALDPLSHPLIARPQVSA